MTPEQAAEVLAARTPGELHWHTYGHRSVRAAAGAVTRALFKSPVPVATDLTWVHSEDEDGLVIALTGNGPKSWDNAAAITVAINLADEWQAVAEAAQAVLNAAMADPVVGTGRHARMLGCLDEALVALDKKRETL